MEASEARSKSAAAHRSKSLNTPREKSGIQDPIEREKAKKKSKLGQRKMNYMGKAGMFFSRNMRLRKPELKNRVRNAFFWVVFPLSLFSKMTCSQLLVLLTIFSTKKQKL